MMNDHAPDASVNRDEPIPAPSLSGNDSPSSDQPKRKRERLKESISGSTAKLKEKVQEHGSQGNKEYGYSLQDRLFTK